EGGVVSEGPDPVDALWAMADLTTPMAIRVAATLRIADRLAAGATTSPQLAEAVGAHAEALDAVLLRLAQAGVVRRDGSARYALTAVGDVLRDDHPDRLRAALDIESPIGRADLSFVQLLHS